MEMAVLERERRGKKNGSCEEKSEKDRRRNAVYHQVKKFGKQGRDFASANHS